MKDTIKTNLDISLILSSVRALWGSTVSSLRSVSIEVQGDSIIWQCIFDDKATDDELELLSASAGEVISDFPDYNLKEIIKRVPYPEKVDYLKNLIYQRFEQ